MAESVVNKRILCVGMCVLDAIHVCPEYPDEDSDRRSLNGYLQRGGNASNTCTVLRQLNVDCEFLGILSDLEEFRYLSRDCLKRGISIENCPKVQDNPPFSSIILNQKTGTRTIVHSNNNFPILTYKHFAKLQLSNYSWIHFEARNVLETSQMIEMVLKYNDSLTSEREKNIIKISLELEKCDRNLLTLCAKKLDYIFLGRTMAEYLGWSSATEAVYGFRQLLNDEQLNHGDCNIICPWGSSATAALNSKGELNVIKCEQVQQVIDSLGAGDTFIGGFIYATKHLYLKLPAAIKYANDLAGYKIQQRGFDHLNHFPSK